MTSKKCELFDKGHPECESQGCDGYDTECEFYTIIEG